VTVISIDVNGRTVRADVEPRTSLADFLRCHELLTGTRLGCEHGVCGSCTVLIDDMPARSCITFAVALDGNLVRTIKGFDSDPVMERLREAFSAGARGSVRLLYIWNAHHRSRYRHTHCRGG
jgi:carbon-monoxide dehydrogenase small subunit